MFLTARPVKGSVWSWVSPLSLPILWSSLMGAFFNLNTLNRGITDDNSVLFSILPGTWKKNFLVVRPQTDLHVFNGPKYSYVLKGLPYIPRVHLSEGSFVRSPLRWLCSEEPMVRRSFIPKFLYSESCYVPKIPYSERPPTIWILCYEGSLVRSSSSPKVLCSELPYSENRPSPIRVLYYEGPFVRSPSSSKIAMFRRFYLPNVARSIRIVCCEGSLFWKF